MSRDLYFCARSTCLREANKRNGGVGWRRSVSNYVLLESNNNYCRVLRAVYYREAVSVTLTQFTINYCVHSTLLLVKKKERTNPVTNHVLPESNNTLVVVCSEADMALFDLIQFCVPSRQLRSSADTRLFRLLFEHIKSSGRPLFYQASSLWNNLHDSFQHPFP